MELILLILIIILIFFYLIENNDRTIKILLMRLSIFIFSAILFFYMISGWKDENLILVKEVSYNTYPGKSEFDRITMSSDQYDTFVIREYECKYFLSVYSTRILSIKNCQG